MFPGGDGNGGTDAGCNLGDDDDTDDRNKKCEYKAKEVNCKGKAPGFTTCPTSGGGVGAAGGGGGGNLGGNLGGAGGLNNVIPGGKKSGGGGGNSLEFPGKGTYRGMVMENNMPRLGNTASDLGVRVPPDPNADITPDANGNVHSPTMANSEGLSCAPLIQDLPRFRKPREWLGTKPNEKFKVWKIEKSVLGPNLKWLQDKDDHITIGPAKTMKLEEFREALVNTQSSWVKVVPCN